MKKLILLTLTLHNIAFAADKTVETRVPSDFSPTEAYGIAINNEKISVVPGVIQQRDNATEIPVSISYKDGTSLVSSFMKDESDVYIASELINVSQQSIKNYCKVDIDDHNLASTQPALIQALVQVRAEKRALYKEKIKTLLSGDFLTTLKRLEAGFGLDGGAPLSPDMSPYELSERISSLAVVLGNLESQKK